MHFAFQVSRKVRLLLGAQTEGYSSLRQQPLQLAVHCLLSAGEEREGNTAELAALYLQLVGHPQTRAGLEQYILLLEWEPLL